jgi:hypothetical protein
MNLKEIIDAAIKITDDYSQQGEPVDELQNADYRIRMKSFLDDAQREIAKIVKIEATAADTFTQAEVTPDSYAYVTHSLPTDFKEINIVYLEGEPFLDYSVINGKFRYYNAYNGNFEIYYYKKPAKINISLPEIAIELEVNEDGQALIPYALAYMAAQTDKPNLSSKIFNIYQTKLAFLIADVAKEKKINQGFQTIKSVTGW